MTVSTTTSRVQYNGNGATTVFPFAFPVLAQSHLQVTLTDVDGVDTAQILTTHYTVSGVGNPAGGSITMLTAPASGETLTIRRVVPNTQALDLQQQGDFLAENIEEAFDLLVMQLQQLDDDAGRALTFPDTDPTTLSGELPAAEDRATRYLAFDANGEPIASSGAPDSTVPVSAFAETLLDDASAAAARATLGEGANGSFFTKLHKFDATTAPTANDDTGDGYSVGSFWFDVTNDVLYSCLDATAAAAVWRVVSTAGYRIRAITLKTSGNYTIPAWLTAAVVLGVGGGGAGGGAAVTTGGEGSVGGGGSAGAFGAGLYTRAQLDAAATASVITLTYGAAGAGASAAAGGNGGTSSFGSLLSCPGGPGGAYIAAGTGDTHTLGGGGASAGTGGLLNLAGAPGEPCFRDAALVLAGSGASSPLGRGAQGGRAASGGTSSDGAAATGYGAGGSGAYNEDGAGAHTGGNGSAGAFLIVEFD